MLNFQLAGFDKVAKGLDPRKVEKAFDWQLTSTARRARTLVSQQVRRSYNNRAGLAGLLGGGKLSTVRIRKLKHKRVLLYRANMIGLDKMSASRVINTTTPRTYGVNVTIRQGQRKRVKGGFLGKSRDRKRTFVYTRVGNQKTKNKKDKLERKFTISVAHMVGRTNVAKNGNEVVDHFAQGFKKRLDKMR